MNRKVIGAALVGLLFVKFAGHRHGFAGGHGPGHRRRLDANDPRRQWILEFHRSLHEADAEALAGTTADAAPTANPSPAD
jgi:hypothetical protein